MQPLFIAFDNFILSRWQGFLSGMKKKRELDEIVNRLKYQLKGIIRKLNIQHQYIDSDDLYQEVLLYLWQKNENGELKNKNNSYILQGCYYHLKNYIRKSIKLENRKINYDNSNYMPFQNQEINEKKEYQYQSANFKSPDEYLLYNEFNQNLSVKERALLNLRIKGLTTREIGRELGISHTMVSKMRRKMVEKYQSYNQL